MYRCTRVYCGVLAVLVGELKKVPAYVFYKAREGAKTYVGSASKAIEFLKGEDPNEDPVMRGKRRQHRELYQAVLREQASKAQEDAAQRRANLSWKEKLQLSFKEARESVAQMTSAKAGVMALLQHCTASHTAEVALEQGIDVKNVQMVFEKAAANNSVGVEEIVVGYIDAPGASHEEVMAFAEKLHKVCPVAKSMHIEWRQGSADSRRHEDGSVRRADGLHCEMEQAASGVEWAERRTGGHLGGPSSAADAALTTSVESMPAGMPGSRRAHSSMSSWAARGGGSGSLRDDEDELHFPGFERRGAAWDSTRYGSSRAKEPSTETSAASYPPPPPESTSAATTQPGACSSDPASSSPSPKP
ncbi:conserved hypothetical protein [Leishmania infantum JPCM5]|uniref:OsmC-like_protein_-_putative n=2 Tax=Leishmania infantum TaxID=5671 RepID=A0A6L0XNW2_LEIIN|nr:conserved hypothetical protein [Leishmania infantum JPCM5]CAC9537726.1 OsmC-like_protein_-_putative [Leishmania infantum]CAM71596.1 conserved hypothetical protein [Leishmania infantum JPCM5]SUZ45508.1 OsmC-like_protein_-_putative [Leishmania infantum]|eukprot:XP_001468512.1 conserved hypothetical protein [Leishmania infantum JPCM5]